MSINHLIVKKELDGYFKKLECNSLNLNGTPFVPETPVQQIVRTYTMSSGNTVSSSTNLYYKSDSNELNLRARVNFNFDGVIPLSGCSLLFTLPDEVKSFELSSTPIYNGYISQQYPLTAMTTNALLNNVLLAGSGEVLMNFSFANTQSSAGSFTAVFDISLIRNTI